MDGDAEIRVATEVGFRSADCAVAAVRQKIGASAPFADPHTPSPDADVFWSPDAVTFALQGTAFRRPMGDVDLVRLPAVRQLLVSAKGAQHLAFISEEKSLSVVLEGTPIAVAPVRVMFHVDGFEHLHLARHGLAALSDFLHDKTHRENHHWTTTSLTVRDALVALDGHQVGASYRDIATVIFGSRRTNEAWQSENNALKDRVRRVLKRGLILSQGAYREFL